MDFQFSNVESTKEKKTRTLSDQERSYLQMIFNQNPKITYTQLKSYLPQFNFKDLTFKSIKEQCDYKIIDSGDDAFFNHFAFQKGVAQSPYQYEHLKTFSQMLFYSISKVLSNNQKYVEEIDQPRENADMDIQIIKGILFELTELISDTTGDTTEDVDLWQYFQLFLYPEYAPACDTSSQKNAIYKFLHVSIKLMIKNYQYDEYICYQSVFRRKVINTSFEDFVNAINNLSTDKQQLSYYQTIMQKALQKFSQWYRLRELKWQDSQTQLTAIQQQLFTAEIKEEVYESSSSEESQEKDFSIISLEEQSEEDQVDMQIDLDQNAGKIPSKEILQEYSQLYTVNNIHGYQNNKRELRAKIETLRKELLKLFGYDRVYYNTSATESFQRIFQQIPTLQIFDGNHDYIQSQQNNDNNKFACLINLVNSSTTYDQTYQITKAKSKGFKYIICDATQAIGRINIPDQIHCQCLFFSTHKYTGLFAGFIFMSDSFYEEVFNKSIIRHAFQYDDIDNTFLEFSSRTFDYPGFIINANLTKEEYNKRPDFQQCQHTYTVLRQVIEDCPYIKDMNKKQDGKNLYSSLLFKTSNDICVRSLQNYLGEDGIQIGFSTACSTGKDGVLRMSWRDGLTQNQLDYVSEHFKLIVKQVNKLTQLKGSGKQNNLEIFNKNSFWLKGHWVKSQDKPISPIPNKYKDCFQDFILNQKVIVGLKIPQIKSRKRVSKNFWINPELSSTDRREQIIVNVDCYITPDMFKQQDQFGVYNQLPDVISQEFDGKYFMSKYRYNFIKDNGLDISHEYAQKNNPMSEFVLQIKKPIKELLISACNSYANNRSMIKEGIRTKCSMYRTGEDYFDYQEKSEDSEQEKEIKKLKGKGKINPYEDTIRDEQIDKYIYIVQPLSTIKELKKARDLCDQLIIKNASFLFITDSNNVRFINPKLKKYEDSSKWCNFDNFQHYWLQDFDRTIYYYNYDIK